MVGGGATTGASTAEGAPGLPGRIIPQALGVIADVAAVSALLVGGGEAWVWAGSFGAVVAGAYIVWAHWGREVDRTVIAGIAVAVAGAGVFGYAVGDTGEADGSSGSSGAARADIGEAGDDPDTTGTGGPRTSTTPTPEPTEPSSTSTTTAAPAGPPTYLADTQPTSDGMLVGEWRIDGTPYPHSLGAQPLCISDAGTATYEVGGSYRRFQATIGATDDMYDDDRMLFVVELDGVEIARRPVTPRQPGTVDVDISGGDELRLTVTETGNCIFTGTAVWGDARVIP
jgi:hypothetical protein